MGFVFDTWPFRASKIESGHVVEELPLKHLAEATTVQSWDLFDDGDRYGNIDPASDKESGPNYLAQRSHLTDADGNALDTPEVAAAVDSIERILNPRTHSPESVDCVSCHAARFVKARAIESGRSFTSTESYEAPEWANTTRAQDPHIEAKTANLIQFGYFVRLGSEGVPNGGGPLPSVSERVIHESIEAAALASSLLP